MVVISSILLVIRIPSLDVVCIRHWGARHELILLDGIDVDSHMFSHESDSEGVGESADFEWFACHCSTSQQVRCVWPRRGGWRRRVAHRFLSVKAVRWIIKQYSKLGYKLAVVEI
jgi:hypothetical protein